METKIIKFETSNDKIKGKILISEKEVEINQRFKTTFIISKEILNYKEDLIAYILVEHTYKQDSEHSKSYLSIAKQIKIPFNTYKEYDEDNVCYETDIYIPEYNEYIYNRKGLIKDPKLPFRCYVDLSEDQYFNINCKVGIMRESELYASNLSKIIKEKNIKLTGQKGFIFHLFRIIFVFLCTAGAMLLSPYILNKLPFKGDLTLLIVAPIYFAIFIGSNKLILKVFKVRPTTKPKE